MSKDKTSGTQMKISVIFTMYEVCYLSLTWKNAKDIKHSGVMIIFITYNYM